MSSRISGITSGRLQSAGRPGAGLPAGPAPRRSRSSRGFLHGPGARVGSPHGLLALAVGILPLAACENLPLSLGDENSIIVTAAPELWEEIEGSLVPALERTVFTVRDEKTFTVTSGQLGGENWFRLRQLKRQLVLGTPSDPWMAPALDKVGDPVAPPRIAQVENVWARGQVATLVILEEGSEVAGVTALLPSLADLYDTQFRARAVARMFVTDPDTVLSHKLAEEYGFTLLVPAVYRYVAVDSVHIFRNDNPDPSELIRQFTVTWQGLPAEEAGGEGLLAWRARIVDGYYDYPQVANLDRVIEERAILNGNPTYTYQAVWENPPGEYPAAGPFIARAVDCPDQGRRYLIDAWLYAPGKDKYQYMIQLEQILDSFRCTRG